MDCLRSIKSVLPRFYPTWSSRTMQALHENTKVGGEGLGSRLCPCRIAQRPCTFRGEGTFTVTFIHWLLIDDWGACRTMRVRNLQLIFGLLVPQKEFAHAWNFQFKISTKSVHMHGFLSPY